MRGAGHAYAICFAFPAVEFSITLFSYYIFTLLPISKGAEKMLLVWLLLLSDAFGKLIFQREGTGQA